MPGLLDNNLRSAYLHEELGVLLLRWISAVTPVPRPDDHGIDAICHLFSLVGGKRNLVIKGAFYAQLKAQSIRSVKFSKKELDWLKSLELPYFFAKTDLKNSSISIFSINKANTSLFHWPELVENPLILYFEEIKKKTDIIHKIFLGPPIASWSISDLTDYKKRNEILRVLSEWQRIEMENAKLRRFDSFNSFEWNTNNIPVINGRAFTDKKSFDVLKDLEDKLEVLLHDAIRRKDTEDWKSLHLFVNYLRRKSQKADVYDRWTLFEQMAKNEGLTLEK